MSGWFISGRGAQIAALMLACCTGLASCNMRKTPPATVAVPEDTVVGDLGHKIDEYCSSIVPFGFSGTVLVARDSIVVLNKGYGMAIDSPATPNTAATVMSCGSVTKQFTAAAIMRLQMLGKLHTADSLPEFFEGVPPDKQAITLRQVLSHTAGLVNYTGKDYEPADRDATVGAVLREPLRFIPETDYAYSNAGYSLLAAVIERVSGQAYEEFLYEQLLAPAGMVGTGYRRPDWSRSTVAHWYAGSSDFGTPLDKPYPSWNLLGNGDALSTTADLYRWHRALEAAEVLDSTAIAEMYTPVIGDYAYGWRVMETPLGRLAGHGGASDFGSSCQFWRALNDDVAVIVFANRDYDGEPTAGLIYEKILRLVAGEEVDIPSGVSSVSVFEPRSLSGTYNLASGAELSVAAAPGSVIMSGTDQRIIDLMCFPGLANPDTNVTLNRATEECAQGTLDGDWERLGGLLSDREQRFDRIKAFIEAILASEAMESGLITTARAVGTFPSSYRPGLIETVVNYAGEAGGVAFRFIWENNQIIGVGLAGDRRSLRVTFLPVSVDRLIGYHLGIGRAIPARAIRGEGGGVIGIEFEGADGPIIASRAH